MRKQPSNYFNQTKDLELEKEMGNFLMKDEETSELRPALASMENLSRVNHESIVRNIAELPSVGDDTENVVMMNENEGFDEIFNVLDVNQDGVIFKEDMKAIFVRLKEDHSDASILSMIENFNQKENDKHVIDFSTFKSKVSSKVRNPFTEENLKIAFQEVIKIADGVRITGSDNKPQSEIVDIETIIEALDSKTIDNVGNLDNAELKIILEEMVRDGITQGLTFEEFFNMIKDYAADCFLMFGALFTKNHNTVHQYECVGSQEDGIRVLNVDGTLANSNIKMNDADSTKPLIKCENFKRKLETSCEATEAMNLDVEESDNISLMINPSSEKQAKADYI